MDINFFGASFRNVFGFDLPEKGGKPVPARTRPIAPGTALAPLRYASPEVIQGKSFVAPDPQDGALIYQYGAGTQITSASFDDIYRSEGELVTQYRNMSLYPECDSAIDDIVNAMLISEPNKRTVSLNLDKVKVSDSLKEKIREEFDVILKLMQFKTNYYRIAKRWYVDGRLYYHIMIDRDNPKAGIKELRLIDPRQIRKIRGVNKVIDPKTGASIVMDVNEFYLYNPWGILANNSLMGIPVSTDSICYCNSGEIHPGGTNIIGHLHKAIRSLNQLKIMEDAVVIYRMTRAPERRVFYVDVGNLPTNRAEQYVRDLMNRFKNRLIYNQATGEVGDDRRYLAMQEDFWLPRREGGRGTQIDTLKGGENLGKMDDVDYYLRQLYKSLNVPVSRLDPNTGFNLGRSAEIRRDEIKFSTFTNRLRSKFSDGFNGNMRVQLILKGITNEKGWEDLVEQISYDYISDSYFEELKDAEIFRERLDLAEKADPFVGTYFSHVEVKKQALRQTDEDIERIKKEISEEGVGGQFSVRGGKVVSTPGDAEREELGVDPSKGNDVTTPEEELEDNQNGESPKYSSDNSEPKKKAGDKSDRKDAEYKVKRRIRSGQKFEGDRA